MNRKLGFPGRVPTLFSRFLHEEDGQEVTEYAVTSFALLLGGAASFFTFIPSALNAYNIYIHSFYMILGLPIP
jgi:hypothetical protein